MIEYFFNQGEYADYWKFKDTNLRKLPNKYIADFGAVHGVLEEVTGLIEIKMRNFRSNAFPSYMVSLHKWIALTRLHESLRIPVLLIVRWEDVTGICNCHQRVPFMIKWKGRFKDQRDDQDQEPCAMLPLDQFRRVDIKPVPAPTGLPTEGIEPNAERIYP